jgi:hypothetical protein
MPGDWRASRSRSMTPQTAHRRFPESPVQYRTAYLLDLPAAWDEAFDLVIESLTVQSLPDALRREAIANVGKLVALGDVDHDRHRARR